MFLFCMSLQSSPPYNENRCIWEINWHRLQNWIFPFSKCWTKLSFAHVLGFYYRIHCSNDRGVVPPNWRGVYIFVCAKKKKRSLIVDIKTKPQSTYLNALGENGKRCEVCFFSIMSSPNTFEIFSWHQYINVDYFTKIQYGKATCFWKVAVQQL